MRVCFRPGPLCSDLVHLLNFVSSADRDPCLGRKEGEKEEGKERREGGRQEIPENSSSSAGWDLLTPPGLTRETLGAEPMREYLILDVKYRFSLRSKFFWVELR